MSFFDDGAARKHGSNKTFSRNNRQKNITTEERASQPHRDYVSPRSKIKNVIVMMAIWGVVPYQVAEFFIKFGGLAND